MGGAIVVEDLPYNYGYRSYPFGERRVPFYSSSFPGHWGGDGRTYYDNSVHGGNSVPTFVVEAPFTEDASLDRKRKLDGLKGEEISSGGSNVRNIEVENGSKSRVSSSSSKSMRSPAASSGGATQATRFPKPPHVNATEEKQSSASSVEKTSPNPHVISIPVVSINENKENSVKCRVVPQEGTKRSRKEISAVGAALLIQSWFRGYEVRKTEPLKQLRRIAKVKSQFAELDQKATDAAFISYARENSPARMKLTEDIMNLLLQLDDIQGAHPVVREIRKITTKQVINLQARVDTLFSTEKAFAEPSQLPMETEEARREEIDQEILPAPESQANDSVASAFVDAEENEDPCDRYVEEQANSLRMSHVGAENDDKAYDDSQTQVTEPEPNQENGEVGVAEGSLESMEIEASAADVEVKKTNDTMAKKTVESDPDEGNGEVRAAEWNPEPLELEPFKPDIEGIKKSVVSDVERAEVQVDQPSEAHAHDGNAGEIEPSSDVRREDGEEGDGEIDFARVEKKPEVAELTTAEANTVRMNTSDERAVQSHDGFEDSPHLNLQRNEELQREEFDDRIHENIYDNATDLSVPDDGEIVYPLKAKPDDGEIVYPLKAKDHYSQIDTLVPHSPRTPFEAGGYMDLAQSNSDSEHQSELQASGESIQSASAQGEADSRAQFLKLSEENKALKSLLVTVMKWNQMQATTMQDVNDRLGKLENRMSPRIGKKKSNSHRRAGKGRRMMI